MRITNPEATKTGSPSLAVYIGHIVAVELDSEGKARI